MPFVCLAIQANTEKQTDAIPASDGYQTVLLRNISEAWSLSSSHPHHSGFPAPLSGPAGSLSCPLCPMLSASAAVWAPTLSAAWLNSGTAL